MSERMKIRIEDRLRALNISGREASLKAGLGPDAIRDIKNGKSGNPKGETLVRLAEALECSVSWLVGEDEKAVPPPPPKDKDGKPLDIRARRLRVARLAFYGELEDAAAALDMPATALLRMETGEDPIPDSFTMQFAAATRTPLDFLFLGRITGAMEAELAARIALFDPELVQAAPLAKKLQVVEDGKATRRNSE